MTRYGFGAFLGLSIVFVMSASPTASAGIFDIFHHDECCCSHCCDYDSCCPPSCCQQTCCEQKCDKKEQRRCCCCLCPCLCPPPPPEGDVVFSIAAEFNTRQPFARDKKNEELQLKQQEKLEDLEKDLLQLSRQVKALSEALYKINDNCIDKNKRLPEYMTP